MADETIVAGGQQDNAQASEMAATVEITEEMIKSHPLYQQVLAESIERRKEIATLKKQAKTASRTEETPVQAETSVEDIPQWAKALQEQFKTVAEQLQTTKERNLQATVRLALSQYGLPETAATFIRGDDEADIMRQVAELSKIAGVSVSVGGSTSSGKPEDRLAKVLKDTVTEGLTPLSEDRAKSFWS